MKGCASCALNGSRGSHTASALESPWPRVVLTQVLVDLRIVLVVLGKPASQIVMLRELLDSTAGVERAKLPLAFDALLGSFAIERGGRLYLDNPLLAGVLQVCT